MSEVLGLAPAWMRIPSTSNSPQTETIKNSIFQAPKILDRLKAGEVILGDGSYTITLEKRCYVLSNAWTPEAAVEHSDGVKELALEFARAGGDVTQTYTFFSDDQRLKEWHGPNVPCVSKLQNSLFRLGFERNLSSALESTKWLAKLPRMWPKKKAPSLPAELP